MHDAGHLRRRQEHGFFLPFDAHEAEAGAIGAHDSLGNRVRPWPAAGAARRCDRRSAVLCADDAVFRGVRVFLPFRRFK